MPTQLYPQTLNAAMRIEDDIYGVFDVTSDAVIDIINCRSMQRLKRISQFGVPDEFYHRKNVSRYDHSVGVMLLLRSLGATEEEQIAGLLHDVSHRAFSHVYDWLVEDHTQTGPKEEKSQDKNHLDFIQRSEIPQILTKHGFDVDRITNYSHFTLLESDLPLLCADRADYSLRELPSEQAQGIFKGLTTADGQIVCADFETAAKFGRAFLMLQVEHWGGYEAVARYAHFSAILKEALKTGIIMYEDFLIDDQTIVAKLKRSANVQILKALQALRQNPLRCSSESGEVFYKKFRFIDPVFMANHRLTCLTEVDQEFDQLLDAAREENETGIIVPNLW